MPPKRTAPPGHSPPHWHRDRHRRLYDASPSGSTPAPAHYAILQTPPPQPRPERGYAQHHRVTVALLRPPAAATLQPAPPHAENEPPSDSQFVAFLHSLIPTLPTPTHVLYDSAMRNLALENTQDLTGEMRASLTSALTAFVAHLPTADWEGNGTEGRFLTRLARGAVSGRELVL
ncbi:uncharacterized protein LAJ45_06866 [Morchella importuna]|uniref:uncharacterized protein n=1 Tax=Morchella importuna TaxID=1174673 RepID=UPI001E8CA1BC|nr:uncharacterized protein LAJ45_06866 [Morchella importuna]KAH8148892.1 hypothetical protein LAJ45_06866 [Morchella importuna]